jgi:response regulator RpfG family c-di-GMP phosphodiesterase
MHRGTAVQDQPALLVVDDSSLLRNILREELEAEGFDVHLAEGGEVALQLARDLRPDLILLDVVLPELDGVEVCRRLKDATATQDIPVVLLSSRNELKDKLAGFEAGADDYLTKPFFTKELVARLRSHLRVRDVLEGHRRVGELYLELLVGFGSAITSPFQVDDEVEIILRQALRATGCPRGSILLHDADSDELEVRGTAGYLDGGPRVGERCRIEEKLPVGGDPGPGGALAIRIYEDRDGGTLFVPMVAKERLVGGIELEPAVRDKSLSAPNQKVLYALASQAAIFIENARLERDVRAMFLNIIVSLAGAVDTKDAYTHGHSLRVARMAVILGRASGMRRDGLEPLLLSAILHDVGKIGIPDQILKKPERLTSEEFDIMKGHVTAGARLLSHIPALEQVLPGILHHHESWDGSGYPDGLVGEDIPLPGRIILVADAFDAMTTDRVYRKGMLVQTALERIEQAAGTQFDPGLAALLRREHDRGEIDDEMTKSTPTIMELIGMIQES